MFIKTFLSFSLFLFIVTSSSAQNIVVQYEEHGKHINSPRSTIYFQKLTINDSTSTYKIIGSDNKEINVEEKLPVYKDLKNNLVYTNHFVLTKEMPVKDTLSQLFDWQLVEGSKEILGYECKRAKVHYRGRNFEAWYAPTIPVRNGPYKFHGLPGLILAINTLDEDESGFVYSVIATGVQFSNNPMVLVNPYKDTKTYSFREFSDKYIKLYEKFQHYVKRDENSTTTFSIPKGGIELYVYD